MNLWHGKTCFWVRKTCFWPCKPPQNPSPLSVVCWAIFCLRGLRIFQPKKVIFFWWKNHEIFFAQKHFLWISDMEKRVFEWGKHVFGPVNPPTTTPPPCQLSAGLYSAYGDLGFFSQKKVIFGSKNHEFFLLKNTFYELLTWKNVFLSAANVFFGPVPPPILQLPVGLCSAPGTYNFSAQKNVLFLGKKVKT